MLVQAMLEDLTEDEMAAYRHGRNAKTSSVAKHADIHVVMESIISVRN